MKMEGPLLKDCMMSTSCQAPSHHFVGLTDYALVEGGEGEPGISSSHGLHAPDYKGRGKVPEIATSLPGCTVTGDGQETHPQGHPLRALWHCQSRAGTTATMPYPKIPWVHTHDPDLPCALVQVPPGPGPEGAEGRMGRDEIPGEWGSWHQEPTYPKEAGLRVNSDKLHYLFEVYLQKFEGNIIKNFKTATREH